MIKKIFITILLSITLISNSYSAGSSSSGGEGDGPKTKTNYEKAVKLIKSANKYEKIGKNIAKKIISKGIKEVAFDRGKYKYHGLIKILADAARVEGLNF